MYLKINIFCLLLLTNITIKSGPQTSPEPTGQSPRNLTKAYVINIEDIQFHYPLKLSMTITADHHTVKATPVEKSLPAYITIDNERYDLLQFHTHTPSEHSIEGATTDAEIHFVHKNRAGNKLSVIGVLVNVKKTAPSSALDPLITLLQNTPIVKDNKQSPIINDEAQETLRMKPATAQNSTTLGTIDLNIYEILPSNKTRYRYSGSLTTPPYSEGVEWNVLNTPITVSSDFVSKVKALTAENTAREIQLSTTPLVLDEINENIQNMPPEKNTGINKHIISI